MFNHISASEATALRRYTK